MAVFFRLLFESDKVKALDKSVKEFNENIYIADQKSFENIPTSPLAYWVSERITKKFKVLPSFENKEIGVKATKGLATTDDFRFIRAWWEVSDNKWLPLAKGGAYSPFYADINLVINWKNNGRELKAYLDHKIGKPDQWSRWINAVDYYKKPGLTWPNATTSDLSVRILPENCIFSHMAPTVFIDKYDELTYLSYLAVMNSSIFRLFVSLSLGLAAEGRKHYEVGVIQNIPMPSIEEYKSRLAPLSKRIWSAKRYHSKHIENSRVFEVPNTLYKPDTCSDELEVNFMSQINEICFEMYGIDEDTINCYNLRKDHIQNPQIKNYEEKFKIDLISWAIGVVLGRFNQLLLKEQIDEKLANPFAALPAISPAMSSVNLESTRYFEISEVGNLIEEVQKIETDLNLDFGDFTNTWITTKFFEYHLRLYTDSRRQAPIYWPLQTPSGSYTLWVYYHRLNEQTLYTCINDFVEPKLAIVIADLNSLRNKSARSTEEEKELTQLTELEAELKDFHDELLRLAKFWKPNLNDGVQITAAPLWKLFQHKAWQKKLKGTWEKLEDGEYDWAHLAGSIWPERVLRKCHQDRSLAIAHEVEDIFWHEVEIPIMRGKKPTGNTKIEWQPKNLTDTEITALIKQTVIGSK